MKNYTLLTKASMLEAETDEQKLDVLSEQIGTLEAIGVDYYGYYFIKVLASDFQNEEEEIESYLDNAVECMSAKEGIELVRFENGNVGFVGYYGEYRSAIEIIGKAEI